MSTDVEVHLEHNGSTFRKTASCSGGGSDLTHEVMLLDVLEAFAD